MVLFVLRFYGPVNPMGSCRAQSVYLTTRLLGRLSPLTSIVHILLPTDNCSSWISGRERMTIENISWSISTKECCRPRRGLNLRPPGLQSDGASNWATEAGRFDGCRPYSWGDIEHWRKMCKSHWSAKYRSRSPSQDTCRVSISRRSTMQGLVARDLTLEEIWNVDVIYVKVTAAKI